MGANLPDASLDLAPDAERRLAAFLEGSPPPPEPAARATLKRLVPRQAMGPLRVGLTRGLQPRARRAIARAIAAGGVRLHLGSGFEYKPGWTNVDLAPVRTDVPWNLARGIPFPDGSVDAVFHEHLMEHLTLRQGFDLARESLRVLRPGGILRIGVPDAGEVVQSYAGNWDDDWARSAPTPMIAIQRLFYEHGHRAMYDGQTLTLVLRTAGFRDTRREPWGSSRIVPCPDSLNRRGGTLYAEGEKPLPPAA